MYGYKDSGELAPGKQGGKFGLNTGAHVTKFEYNPNSGKDGAAGDGLDFTVQIGEKEFKNRFFPISKVYKDNVELTNKNSPEYKEEFEKALGQFNAVISDIVKCFVSEEELKAALAVPIPTFKDYANIVTRLVQSTPNWQKKPVDVFLQYQWTPTGNNDRTFLELPKNVKHGIFIIPSEGEGFKEVKTEDSVKYVKEDGTEHPFKRGSWFMTHAFGQPTVLNSTPSIDSGASGGAAW